MREKVKVIRSIINALKAKTNKTVYHTLLTIARKCKIRFSDLIELYDDLRELGIKPKKCLSIMNVIYKRQIQEYENTMESYEF